MSPMEKNTEPSGSVVETFKAYFSGHCLRGTDAFGVCIYSDQSPLGWRLGLKCRAGKGITGKPKMNFLFDPKSVNPRLGRLYISIDVREEHALQYRELVEAFEVQALPDVSPSKIGSWEISGSCLAIRFTVAWGPGRTRLSKSEPEGLVISVAMQKSLADSMQDGQFLDTRFFAYSKRRHLGRVDTPLPVYANSELLKDKSPYFTTLLSSEDFSECSLNVLEGGFPKDQQSFFDDYDYGSDSDLEDETLFQEETCDSEPAALLSAEAQARSPGNARDIGLVHSSENDGSESASPAEQITSGAATPHRLHGRCGRTVVVKDVAHKTFRALIYYLYTRNVAFAPLRSERRPVDDDRPYLPLCSPKSMYRLADKLGFEELKELAFQAIKSCLSDSNIVHENFTKFTSLYDEIRMMETDILCASTNHAAVREQLPRMIEKIADGQLPHSAPMLSSLVLKLASQTPSRK